MTRPGDQSQTSLEVLVRLLTITELCTMFPVVKSPEMECLADLYLDLSDGKWWQHWYLCYRERGHLGPHRSLIYEYPHGTGALYVWDDDGNSGIKEESDRESR